MKRDLTFDFSTSLGFWVGLTSHLVSQSLNRALANTGITHRQVQLLATLAFKKEVSQTELADDMRIEAPTLVRILDRMERDGWIERHPSPDDRRKKLIRATAKVAPMWRTIVKHGQQVEKRATTGISKQRLDALRSTLEQIQDNLGDAT